MPFKLTLKLFIILTTICLSSIANGGCNSIICNKPEIPDHLKDWAYSVKDEAIGVMQKEVISNYKKLQTMRSREDGFEVYRSCWEWKYQKTCNYPSKNDCSRYAHCYAIALTRCLLYDTLNNCVNQEKEFSCKRWVPDEIESSKTRTDLQAKDGEEKLICKNIPCIDGNCIDKSYLTNGEMMDSISKLYAVSQMKDGGNPNIELFKGYNAHCIKK